ncbi:MAG: imidazole glycerol phosphate synthase subunit HisH, partial [Gammaproteobacteria bacterium]|nr:imidazole glycerol phosphate synthase subunit HisH [Gammaproteobacteria bacterium]
MQGLMHHSTENNGIDCLSVFPYDVTYFSDAFAADNRLAFQPSALKVPHMGWNRVTQVMDHPLWKNIANNARFYFVHSYFIAAHNCDAAAGIANYGIDIAAAIARDNIFAVQFHPEKSHRDGLQLLQNFMQWDGSC